MAQECDVRKFGSERKLCKFVPVLVKLTMPYLWRAVNRAGRKARQLGERALCESRDALYPTDDRLWFRPRVTLARTGALPHLARLFWTQSPAVQAAIVVCCFAAMGG